MEGGKIKCGHHVLKNQTPNSIPLSEKIITNKVLIIIGTEKLDEVEELKVGPVNVLFPRSATTTILAHHFTNNDQR